MTLEVVRESKVQDTAVHYHALTEWFDAFGLTAGVTSRGGDFDDFSLGLPQARARWLALRHEIPGDFSQICTGRQVHQTDIIEHRRRPFEGWALYEGIDGHVTGESGALLTVTIADCVPVFLYCPDTGQMGLLHAGWRGVAEGILQKGIEVFESTGANPRKLVLHLGPSVCGDCYEVGSEVVDALGLPIGARSADLRAVLAENARKMGLTRITRSALVHKTR